MLRVLALIPARSGSKRVPGKNIRLLGRHPLIAYTITSALQSGVFQKVVVSTDSLQYANIAHYYGAEAPFLRPPELSGELSPDIEFVEHAIQWFKDVGETFDCFSILRPTSPFRMPETIQRAWQEFSTEGEKIDSLRAVEKCKQHPGKMWVIRGDRMLPLLPLSPHDKPWHSNQYQALPEVYVQNASLEIAWTRVVLEQRTIAGNVLLPFFTQDHEGFDVNNPYDWKLAEELIQNNQAKLPYVSQEPYKG